MSGKTSLADKVVAVPIIPGNVYALEDEGKQLSRLIADLSMNVGTTDKKQVKEAMDSLKTVQELINGILKYNGSKKFSFNLWS